MASEYVALLVVKQYPSKFIVPGYIGLAMLAVPVPKAATATNQIQNSLDLLTKREKEIVGLISCGHSNGDIAKMLVISEHTVKDHTKNIYRKLGIHSRYELMVLINH